MKSVEDTTHTDHGVDFMFWPRGYKILFMLNSAEHENFSANKYENAKLSWHFHIY